MAALVVLAGALLIATVAPEVAHPMIPKTSIGDIEPNYAGALGGTDTAWVDRYVVTSELPGFVGHAAYPGEQLLVWWPEKELATVIEPIGIFHSRFNGVNSPFPNLVPLASSNIEYRRPAEILLMSVTGQDFFKAVKWLKPFKPQVVKQGVLSDGSYHLHLWLVDLRRYLRHPSH
jgi:hypothetical protein